MSLVRRSGGLVAVAAGLVLAAHAAAAADAKETGEIIRRGELEWKDLLTDNATGPVTAATMLGMKGDALRPVENLRDLVVSLEGLGADGEKGSFGLAVTPARTSLARPQMARYDDPRNWPYRLLTATTFSYAQGKTTLRGAQYARRAVAVEAGFFLDPDDDPVRAVNKAYREQVLPACAFGKLFKLEPPPFAAEPPPLPAAPGPAAPAVPATPTPGPAVPKTAPAEDLEKQKKVIQACTDAVLKGLRWNRSYLSASYATGWIKPDDGGGEQRTLGRALVVALVYGFDQVSALREVASLTLAYRRTTDEPVLSTLGSAAVATRDTSLAMARLAGGSSSLRGLLEVSNAKGQVTPSQRAFTRALGLDVRVQKDLWIALRVGRQRTVDGADTEVGSLLSISYSPTALLPD
jgi:hypothetical protein